MPFKKEITNAERALAQIRTTIKEKWGVELSTLYPALVARVALTDTRFELTPLLRDDGNGRVVILGSGEGENLVIEGGNLYQPVKERTFGQYAYQLQSGLVRSEQGGGKNFSENRLRDLKKLADLFGGFDIDVRIEYLFNTRPMHPRVGSPTRAYIVDFSGPELADVGLIATYSFLLYPDWERNFSLGGEVERAKV